MRVLYLSSLLVLASGVLADVTYNVVGFPADEANSYAVEINNKLYPLKTSDATFPLWSANVAGVSASDPYHFALINPKKKVIEREEFDRHLSDLNQDNSPNDFFNRQNTFTKLPALNQVYENDRPKQARVFDMSQIATIHLQADPKDFKEMIGNPLSQEDKVIPATFRFINAGILHSTGKVHLKVGGHGSRKYQKVSLRVRFDEQKTQKLFGRASIKLRSEYSDPTMIREKLYLDVLSAVGVVAQQGSYARVYVNGEAQGFYLMLEDIEEEFLMEVVHHNQLAKNQLGSLFKMGSGRRAAMLYQGPESKNYDAEMYDNKIRGDNPKNEPMSQFITFFKQLHDWRPRHGGAIKLWNQRLNLDGFLRSMAVEYLTGAWDSCWFRGNNYFMYYNPQQQQWQFMPTDFDHSFSNGNQDEVDTTYKKYAKGRLERKPHPLVMKLVLENTETNKLFENILLTITKELFNPKGLSPRIDALEKQIGPEVEWDNEIDRKDLPGLVLFRSNADIHNSITGPVDKVPDGIKPWIANRYKSVTKQIPAKK